MFSLIHCHILWARISIKFIPLIATMNSVMYSLFRLQLNYWYIASLLVFLFNNDLYVTWYLSWKLTIVWHLKCSCSKSFSTSSLSSNKDQLSLTNPRDALHHGNVLQTNKVDAQCDKRTTELSWQRFASKVANCQLPHLHLCYSTCIWRLRWGWSRMNFAEIFCIRKLDSLGYRVALFAWA